MCGIKWQTKSLKGYCIPLPLAATIRASYVEFTLEIKTLPHLLRITVCVHAYMTLYNASISIMFIE